MTKVVTSAIVVKPPDEEYPQIQNIRVLYDKGYKRWLPHINMIYPFIPEDQFKDSIGKISNALSNFSPFKLTFSQFQHFEHARSFTVFLKPQTEPPDALQQLFKILVDVFPFCDDLSIIGENGFSPHLTVGQFTSKKETEDKQSEFNRNYTPIVYVVDKIYLISRSGDDPFTIKYTVPFQQPIQPIQQLPVQPLSISDNKIKASEPIFSNTNEDIILISDRILNWLHRQKEINKLPKTFNSLISATQNLCKIPKEIISPNTVYDKLQLEGFYSISGDEVVYNKSKWDPKEKKNFNPNNEQDVILYKCRQWVSQPGNSPKYRWGLMNSFRQLVTITYQVPHEDVLNLLEKIGSIGRGQSSDSLVINI